MKVYLKSILLNILVLLLYALPSNSQTTVNLSAEKDASIFSEDISGSNGAGDLVIGRTNQGALRRALVNFDISSIPSNATVTDATLTIRGSRQSTTSVDLHRLLSDWGEGTTPGGGNGGQPSAAQNGDATWRYSFFDNTFWNDEGGDFVPSSSANSVVNSNTNSTWNDTGVVQDVQSWVSNSAENFGWILIGVEGQDNTAVLMVSSEANNNTPVLSVTYTIPSCDVNGGTLSGGPFEFCVGDNIPDNIDDNAVTISGNSGSNSQWIITDISGNTILGLPDALSDVDFDGAGLGTCLIWNLSYEDGLLGLEEGGNFNGLAGCFSLSSNFLSVFRRQPNGGILSGNSFDFCVGDGLPDNIPVNAVSVSGNVGSNSQWVVTNSDGNMILGLPNSPDAVDFDGAGAGTCLIWHMSHENDLTGLSIGSNINDLMGCFSISSNSITVTRRQPEGGSVVGGPFEFCVGDNTSDNIPVDAFSVTDNSGTNFQWVVTDSDTSVILGLPASPEDVNFDGAGPGTCLVWHLSYEDGLTGLEILGNIDDLIGCYSLSADAITVVRSEDDSVCGPSIEPLFFRAILSGTQQVSPVLSGAKGVIEIELNGNSLSVNGSFNGLAGDFDANVAGGAHIHKGIAGRNGGIEFNLTTNVSGDLKSGSYEGSENTFILTDEQIDDLLNQEYYINVHTTTSPGGELRGQIIPSSDQYFHTKLLGSNEVPSIVSDGFGSIVFSLEDTSLTVSGSFDGLSSAVAVSIAGGSHIHNAMTGRNGDLVFPLDITFDPDTTGGIYEAVNNSFILTQDQIDALLSEGMYVNVHSENFPSGELRGQIAPISCGTFRAELTGAQQLPPICTEANGRILLNYDGQSTITVSGTINDLESPLNTAIAGGMHLHNGYAGRSGGVLFPLVVDMADNNIDGVLLPGNNTFEVDPENINDLLSRGLYVNVHSTDFPSGEIRGQVLPIAETYLGTNLSGLNGVQPVHSPGSGDLQFEINGNTLIVTGGFSGMMGDFDASIAGGSHLHMSNAAGTGGIAVSLNATPDGDLKGGIYEANLNSFVIDEVTRDQLFNGLLYANIHSTSFPSGELRGQVLRDDNSFPDPSFGITSPDDGILFDVDTSSSDLFTVTWEATTDPNNDILVYTWQLASNLDFSDVLVTNKVGSALSVGMTQGDVDDLLLQNGQLSGDTLTYFHRVLASDGSVHKSSPSHSINFFRPAEEVCDVAGGVLTGGPFNFCVGDGISDMIPMDGIVLSENSGAMSQWVVTDTAGNILGLPSSFEDIDFDGAGVGTCLVYHVSYEDGATGFELGLNIDNLQGCTSISNPVTVNRTDDEVVCGTSCAAIGGILTGGPFTFCVGDGIPDHIVTDDLTLSSNSGTNSQWVVTDSDTSTFLGLPDSPEEVDFDGAGDGTCLIWHLSYDDGLTGLEVNANINDLEGCFAFSSNAVIVVRSEDVSVCGPPPCEVDGGSVTGGPFEFCVDDNMADHIPVDAVALSGNSGSNSQWVVTNEDTSTILGLPPSPDAVDFDGAGPGTCLVWNLSFEDGLTGLEVNANINDLDGCFAFSSNAVIVVRSEDVSVCGPPPCVVDGGSVTGGPFEFCVGDNMADHIPVDAVDLTGNSGPNSQWVVTNEDTSTILGLPPSPDAVDFDGAGPGTCLVWNLSFEDGLTGLEVNANVNDLDGCFAFSSNAVIVVRSEDVSVCGPPPCVVDGGSVTGGPFEFCVGDGVTDNIPAEGIALTGNSGSNSQWVVTDLEGNILGLPPSFDAVDFDGAGAGTCLVWHLSYEDGLTGLELGFNVADLEGCFDLSNAIEVIRVEEGDACTPDCQADGGSLEGGSFTFCVGDGVADNIPADGIALAGNSGSNSQWVVTDLEGNILGLPPSFDAVDFDGAGPGTCLVWNLSFEDGLTGLELGFNAAGLEGCFDLSNAVEVIRVEDGEACAPDCDVDGGSLDGGSYTFCVGDGLADNIPAEGIALAGNSGSNSQWVVTDLEGNILGLPPSFDAVDFDGAGAGTCLVWHLSYEDGLTGLELGFNAADLEGCFDLSNAIEVIRVEEGDACTPDCQADGGSLEGGSFTFCVGDGVADNIPADGIALAGNSGSNSQWVVTDLEGNILGLPPSFDAVDFDGAGPGTCLVWNLSFEDGLTGLEVNANINDLDGCFAFSSNAVIVVRSEDVSVCGQLPCEVEAGTIATASGATSFTICEGDGIADRISVKITDSSGPGNLIVTDEAGNILAFPESNTIDFEGAGVGICQIWNVLSSSGNQNIDIGNNISELSGCFSISNPVVITRITCDPVCQMPLNFRVKLLPSGKFRFRWDRVGSARSYEVELGIKDNPNSFVSLNVRRNRLTVSSSSSSTFVIRVRAICGIGKTSEFTEYLEFTNPQTKAAHNRSEIKGDRHGDFIIYNKDLAISPNPANDNLNVRFETGEYPSEIKVYDIMGREVLKDKIEAGQFEKNIEINKLPEGIFLISIIHDGMRIESHQFIISR